MYQARRVIDNTYMCLGIYSACGYTIFLLNIETFLIFYSLLHVELEFPNIYAMFEQYDFNVTLLVMDI